MSTSRTPEPHDITGRLREVDRHARLLLDQWEAAARPAASLPVAEPPDGELSSVRVPVPRRARAYLFHGAGGTRAFADVTLTAPLRPTKRT